MDRKIGEKFEYFDTVSQKTVELVVEETKGNIKRQGTFRQNQQIQV